jgi:hypothetical protein
MTSFLPIPSIKKKVRFAEYVTVRFIPALENTKPIPINYYKPRNKNNNQQIPLLRSRAFIHKPGIRQLMPMTFI